jgi:hypothetical protein
MFASLQGDVENWNLQSDAELLTQLWQFSSKITERTRQFTEKVETLHFDINESEISLRNTFNEFLMLGDKQFIENVRVYVLILLRYTYMLNALHECLTCIYNHHSAGLR